MASRSLAPVHMVGWSHSKFGKFDQLDTEVLIADAVRDALADAAGVRVHHSSIADLLSRLGFTYKKSRWLRPNAAAPR